jgi:hypothetical protein
MQKKLIILILVLVFANVVYWWPEEDINQNSNNEQRSLLANATKLNEIRNLEVLPFENKIIERDLFSSIEQNEKVTSSEISIPQNKPNQKITYTSNKKPPISNYVKKYRLTGVLVRKGTRTAYLLDGEMPIAAMAGDEVSDGVVVLNVSDAYVVIKNTRNGSTKRLNLSGE